VVACIEHARVGSVEGENSMSTLLARCLASLRCLAVAGGLSMTATAHAQLCCASDVVSIDCLGDSQSCGWMPYYSINSRADEVRLSISTPSTQCSDLSFEIYVTGILQYVTDFMGPSQSTGDITLLGMTGSHLITINAVGRVGGCNTGVLQGWTGDVQLCVDQSPVAYDLFPQSLCYLPGYFIASTDAPWPLSYTWYLNGTALVDDGVTVTGANTPVLGLLPGAVAPGDFILEYEITSPCGESIRSNATTMTLVESDPPIITLQPESQTACVGGEAAFRCEATNNSLQVWFYGPASSPTVVLDVPGFIEGSNSDTLRFTNLTEFDDNLEVFSVIFNDCGTAVTSTSAFLTVLPEGACGAPCPADFNQDGGVDGGDIDAFFTAWETGDGVADVNQDGGVDGSDIDTFFTAWEAGGC
jgi:hypothetical protein